MKTQTRRQFLNTTLRSTAAAGAGFAIITPDALGAAAEEIPRRDLGRTGVKVSLFGLGGYHIGVQSDPAESIRLIDAAVDRGVNFLDNSHDYNGGESELRMGKALKGKRDKVFLMTKFNERDKKGALKSLELSLRRLQTDYLDLWQFHSIQTLDEPDWIFAPNGGIEAAELARKQGKVRFIGFTGHRNPAFHARMLAKPFDWDTVQMPLNVLDPFFLSFQRQVLPIAQAKKVGIIAMKPLANGYALRPQVVTPIECLHYAMNLPVSVVLAGCESMARLDQAIRAATTFKPLAEAEVAALFERIKVYGAIGRFEPYKITGDYDNRPQASPPPYEA